MIIINLSVRSEYSFWQPEGSILLHAENYTTLLFDLDETLYESSTGIWQAIRDRIGLFMHNRLGLDWETIPGLRSNLFTTYGTTLRGLVTLYDVDQQDYLDFVHDIPMEKFLKPDPLLGRLLLSYPQRKLIFTNADRNHAYRVLNTLGIHSLFEQIVDIRDIEPHCKPMTEAFQRALELAGADPVSCVMLDDSQSNLATARSLGMGTIRVGSNQLSWDYDECISRIHDLPEVLSINGHKTGKSI
jgi:putative hydrolase of the HAD superfamily